MKVAVTGASGLIGSALVPHLRNEGHDVVRFVRGSASAPDERPWDPGARTLDPEQLADVDAVVHLAGAGVADKRWTPSYKQTILRSRVDGTTAVAEAVAASGRPSVLLSSSAVGWYGDTGDRLTDEAGPTGRGFLAEVCREWEAATKPAESTCRVAHLRTGYVLAKEALGLKKQLAVNGAVPRPTFPVPVPGFALKAALGPFAQEGVLTGQRLAPAVLQRSGFSFEHSDIDGALAAVLAAGTTD